MAERQGEEGRVETYREEVRLALSVVALGIAVFLYTLGLVYGINQTTTTNAATAITMIILNYWFGPRG